MDYLKIYNSIVEKYKDYKLNSTEDYCERHHILPKSFGGPDDQSNIILIPARVHVFCHELLYKHWKHIYDSDRTNDNFIRRGQMAQALYRLYNRTDKQRIRFSSKMIAIAKKDAWHRNKRLRWITDGKNCRMVDKDSIVPDGWRFGYIQENYWDSHMWITDGKVDRIIEKTDTVPAGWQKGRSKGKSAAGKIWITNGKRDIYINKNSAIPTGWRLGRSEKSVVGAGSTRSKQSTRYFFRGQMVTVSQLAEKIGVPVRAVYSHLKKGHAVEAIKRMYDEFHKPNIEYHGQIYRIIDLERISGIARKTIRKYIMMGYSADVILDNYIKGKSLKKILRNLEGQP